MSTSLGVAIQKTLSVQNRGIIKAIESVLGYELSDKIINEQQENIVALLNKGLDKLTSDEEHELLVMLIYPLAKHLASLRGMASAGSHTKAYKRYYMLIDIPEEDLLPIAWIFIREKADKIIKHYSSKSGDFAKYIVSSSAYYIRDKFSDDYKPNISIPRTRNDDKEDTKRMKVMAAAQAAEEFTDSTIEMEISDTESQDMATITNIEIRSIRKMLVANAPLIFARVVLRLDDSEVFLSESQRKAVLEKERKTLMQEGRLKEGVDVEKVLKNYTSKWNFKQEGSVIDWLKVDNDLIAKAKLLISLGLNEEESVTFLEWLKNNAEQKKKPGRPKKLVD